MNKNFLSKKSWHTGSLKHIEKVWKAEQRHQEESRKTAILKREKEEEQRRYEFRKMAEEAQGKKPVDRLDWMYMVRKGPSTEEYLTGSATLKIEEEKELDRMASRPGALFMQSVDPIQDAAAKVRDDPLLCIKQREQQALNKLLDNPMEMKKIKESKAVKKMMKKLEKLKKKQEKREAKMKKLNQELKDEGKRSGSEEETQQHLEHHRRSRSKSRSPPRRSKRSRSRSPHSSHSSKRHRSRSRSHSRGRSPARKSSRTGSSSPNNNNSSSSTNGRGRDESNTNSYSRRDYRDRQKSKPKLTEEERQKRLQEMQADADLRHEMRVQRIKRTEEEDKRRGEASYTDQPSFLNDVNKQVYTEHDESLRDRVRRNIHSIQRSTGTALVHDEQGLLTK